MTGRTPRARSGFGFGTLFFSFILGFCAAAAGAAAVALWITDAPVPLVAKVHQAQGSVDPAVLDGKTIDPNEKLYRDASGAGQTVGQQTEAGAGEAPAAAAAETWWVQAGTFLKNSDAEGVRARIAFIGLDSQIQKVKQNGQNAFQVRIGPFETSAQAEEICESLSDNGIRSSIGHSK